MILYDLQWNNSIGSAEIFRSYCSDIINEDKNNGHRVIVYDIGSIKYGGIMSNHILSDIRVLNSPEYSEWFWI
jgi:hypothetical protein